MGETKPIEVRKVLYIGNDAAYFLKLQQHINKDYGALKFTYKQITYTDKASIQSLICDIEPEVVGAFVDMAANTAEMLHLCRLIKRSSHLKDLFLVGLFDYQVAHATLQESITTGVSINHIKSAETLDIVYDFICVKFTDNALEPAFAVAELDDEMGVSEFLKAGYIATDKNVDKLHIESNTKLPVGQDVEIGSFLTQSKILMSKKMHVKEMFTSNIYYNCNYAFDLEFLYTNLEKAADPAKYTEAVDDARARLNNWFKKNQNINSAKNTKISIIDKEMTLYRDKVRTDSFPFVIRVNPYLPKPQDEIMKIMPQIIVVNLESKNPGEAPDAPAPTGPQNDLDFVFRLVDVIKKVQNYQPFLLLFNSPDDLTAMKKSLGYDKILSSKDPLTSVALIKMANIFEAKIAGMTPPNKKQISISKDNPLSIVELERKLTLKSISETEITFAANFEPEMFKTYRMHPPFNYYFTVVPFKKNDSGKGLYHGVLNGMNEEDKASIRQFINSVFFREHDEKKVEEQEQLAKTAKAYLEKKKMEAEKTIANLNEKNKDGAGAIAAEPAKPSAEATKDADMIANKASKDKL